MQKVCIYSRNVDCGRDTVRILLVLKGTVAGDYLIRCLGSTMMWVMGILQNLKCGMFFFFSGKLHNGNFKEKFERAKTFLTPKLF